MLTCNILDQLHTQIRKEQFGLCFNSSTVVSMAQKYIRYNFKCDSVILCYEPDICEPATAVICALVATQTLSATCTSPTISQNLNI